MDSDCNRQVRNDLKYAATAAYQFNQLFGSLLLMGRPC